MSALTVTLFGRFRVQHDDTTVPGMELRKVQEFFAYLLLFRTRAHARETLATRLWGEADAGHARRYLSKTLWQLQSALAATDYPDAPGFLVVDADWIQLDPAANITLDVAIFEDAVAQAARIPARALTAPVARLLEEALTCYRGELLEGWYPDWCLLERERLHQLYLAALDKLMRYAEARGEFEAGLAFGHRILAYDQAREQTHRQLMRLRFLAGDRTGALRQYAHCRKVLREELGVQPSRSTELLHARIRDGQAAVADAPVARPADHPASVAHSAVDLSSSDGQSTVGPSGDASPVGDPLSADTLQRLLRDVRRIRALVEEIERFLEQHVPPFTPNSLD